MEEKELEIKLEFLRSFAQDCVDSLRIFNIWITELERGIKAKKKTRMRKFLLEARYWLDYMERIGCISEKTRKRGVFLIEKIGKAVS